MSHFIWVLLFCVFTPAIAQYADEQPPIEENPCNLVDCIPNTRCIVVNGQAKCIPLNGYGDKDCETPEPEKPTCATVLCKPPTTCVLRPKKPGCRDDCALEAACVIPVRDQQDVALKRTQPPAEQKCPANEQFNTCGSACEPSCKNPKPEICTLQCVVGCQCKPGFFRNDQNVCVAKCSETPQQQCKANEVFTDCGSACEPSCKNPKPEVCTEQCVVGCQCKPGFFRNDQNECVAKCNGGGAGSCGQNEERKQCGTACEPTCANPNPVCTRQCIIDVCQCKQGYIRDASNKCIPVEQCPKDLVIPCSEMNCPPGTVCELGRVICPFVPPCFTQQTKCVPLTPKETCATKKCPPGTVCEQETIFCFRAPCPQPKPECFKQQPTLTCANVRCRAGTMCRMIDVVCKKAPCDPRPECVIDEPEPYNPCAATTCPVGSECRVKQVQCIRAPCPPIGECYTPQQDQQCGKNESFKTCASHCEPSCTNKSPICILSCAPPKCQCNQGFYRNSSGACVTEADCDGNADNDTNPYSRLR